MLSFGEVSDYLGYNALLDFFPKMQLKPNSQCDDAKCRERQEEVANEPVLCICPAKPEDDTVVHDDNEWGKISYFIMESNS